MTKQALPARRYSKALVSKKLQLRQLRHRQLRHLRRQLRHRQQIQLLKTCNLMFYLLTKWENKSALQAVKFT
ncbi:MAG: hypothetical protein EAZ39_11635, partial [Oscillatoriales cyanobacterium]